MPIPVMQFQPQTFAQAHPGMTGAAAGMSLIDQMESLKQKQMATKLTEAQTQALPLTSMGSYLSGVGKAQQAKYMLSPERQFGRILNSPALQSLMSTSPTVAKYITQALAGMSQRLGGSLQPKGGEPTVQPGAQGTPNLTNLTHPGNTNIATTTPGQGLTGDIITDNDVTQMQHNMADTLYRKMNTAQLINQRQYAGVLDNLFDRGNQQIDAVSRYAGALGKGAGSLAAVQSALGNTSQNYATYLYFTRHTVPNTVNEMRRTLGGQASDAEIALMDKVADPTFWDSNPNLAIGSWHDLENLYKNTVDPALSRRISETSKALQKAGKQKPLTTQIAQIKQSRRPKTYSQADLEFTAKKYGMTIAQVKQKLGTQ